MVFDQLFHISQELEAGAGRRQDGDSGGFELAAYCTVAVAVKEVHDGYGLYAFAAMTMPSDMGYMTSVRFWCGKIV